eukprot:715591-Rhodomonas_salina.1
MGCCGHTGEEAVAKDRWTGCQVGPWIQSNARDGRIKLMAPPFQSEAYQEGCCVSLIGRPSDTRQVVIAFCVSRAY